MDGDITHLNGFDIVEKSDDNGGSTFEVWLDGPNGIFFKEFGTAEEARDYIASEADEDRRKRFDEGVDESEATISMDPEDIGYSHMYKFTFKQTFEAKKFFDFIKKYGNGGSLLKAINDLSVGIEAECDIEEWILTVLNQSAQKHVTVITISDKLPCIDEWEAIAKVFHAKLKYESLDDEQAEKQVFVQGNVKESKEMEEEGKELVGIDNLKIEKDYIDDNGKKFDIYYDTVEESPRKMYDNGATIVILRGKYESPDEITDELEEIADEHGISLSKDCDLNALISALQEAGYYAVPVYILDHGSVHYSTHDFGDKWDSGMAGVAYAKKSGADEKKLQKMIDAELAEYETWANGNVYGISVRNEDGEVVDGESGFYLSNDMTWEDLIKEMLDAVEVKIQDKYERFHGFEDDEDDYEDDEEPIEESRKPKDKRVYAEIYSYGIPSHITWFDNLKTARRELENHIASMTKVGDYEIFRDEEAADIKMQEGDFEITLYVPSGSEDVVDNDVEHVIIRPKKEKTVKEEINNMEKHIVDLMNKTKVIGNPIYKTDFWFYVEGINDKDGNPSVFHAFEGTGDNLLSDDREQGFVDYVLYEVYTGKITYPMIDAYVSGDDIDTLMDFQYDEGMVLLRNYCSYLTVKQICCMVLDEFGVKNTDNLTVRILTGKQKDTNFQKETNESLDDTNSSASKTDVTPVMNKIKVIGSPIDKSDFWFYTEEITDDDGNPTVFHAQEGTGDNLDIEDEEKGFVDYIYYDTYDGEINYSMINNYISGDDYDTLDDFESDGGMILLYNPYTKLTVKQICWHILDMSGVSNPENLTVRILSGNKADDKFKKAEATESLDDTDASGTKTDVTPMMNKIKVIGNPVDKSDFWFYVYNKNADKEKTYHVYAGTGDNLSIEDEKQGFVDYINYDSYKGVDGVGGLDAIDVINNYISGDDEDTLSGFEDDGGMVLLYNPYKNLTVKQICWKVLDMDGVPHPENLTAIILMTVSEIWG